MSDVCRNMLVCPFTPYYCGGEDRVCRSETCSNGEGRKKVEAWNKSIDECSRDEPPLSHGTW